MFISRKSFNELQQKLKYTQDSIVLIQEEFLKFQKKTNDEMSQLKDSIVSLKNLIHEFTTESDNKNIVKNIAPENKVVVEPMKANKTVNKSKKK